MNVVKRVIDIERAMSWVTSALEVAGLKSNEVSQILHTGTSSVLAPVDVSEERLYMFNVGGITPPSERIQRSGYDIAEVKNYANEIAATLRESAYVTSYIHDPLRQPHEVVLHDGLTVTVGGQLLYVADVASLSNEELSHLIKRNSLSWHFLMLCTHGPVLNYTEMISLLSDVDCIVVGAYDGESYLIWERMEITNK